MKMTKEESRKFIWEKWLKLEQNINNLYLAKNIIQNDVTISKDEFKDWLECTLKEIKEFDNNYRELISNTSEFVIKHMLKGKND